MQKKNSHSSKTMPTGKLAAIGQKLNFRPTFPGLQSFGSFSKAALTALISLTLIVFFCYPSAQTYYIQERKTQQLTAVQAAITERNEQVQKNVDALNTDEGIEASAHQEFGYVKDGEGSAIVQGVETESSSKMIQYVDANTITAPSTWYNNILDVIFGYDNTPKK